MSDQQPIKSHGADYETAGEDYLQARKLSSGSAGWIMLAGLGVSYVIAGEFAGWNYGINQAGWGGMFLALLLMGLMYVCLIFSLAELASIVSTAGGGYGFARRAFGPALGFLTGLAITFEYTIASSAVALFFEAYFHALFGFGGLPVIVALYVAFFFVQIRGANISLRLTLILALIAAAGLLVFITVMAVKFDVRNLMDIPVTDAWGAGPLLPMGYAGIWAGLPFAIAMFLAVEGVPLASEEAENPKKDVPRGMTAAVFILFVMALSILIFAPGAAGASKLGVGEDPLMLALNEAYGPNHFVRIVVAIAGLVGIAASFFAILYAFSRQIFSLSRAGYLPRFLSLTNKRHVPYLALLVPGTISFAIALTRAADQMIIIVVFCATLSYLLMMASHIRLRLKEPNLHRYYRTPGGLIMPVTAFVLAFMALIVCLQISPSWSLYAALGLTVSMLYFFLYSRHHLVAQAPEEEFDLIRE